MGQTRRRPSSQTELFPAAPVAAVDGSSPEQQFLRLMSHEMRTPLNGVIGMLGLLSRTRLCRGGAEVGGASAGPGQ
jgi:signal transduction histidine kinase